MSKGLVENIALKDAEKIAELYDSFVDEDDLSYVNPKAEKAIKQNIVVPSPSIERIPTKRVDNLKSFYTDIMMAQKHFLLAKAILVADDPAINAIITQKLGYDESEEEFAIQYNVNMINDRKQETGAEPLTEQEVKLNARAVCLAERFLSSVNNKFREEFKKPGMFNNMIELAEKKDPHFLENSTDPDFVKVCLGGEKMYHIYELERRYVLKEMTESANSLRTKSEISALKQKNDEQIDKKEYVDREFEARQRISQMQKERNGKSALWFVFRPISNLVSYIKLNNAKKEYKENFILPKFEKCKGSEDYENAIQDAVNQFNEEIVSENKLEPKENVKKLSENALEAWDMDEKKNDTSFDGDEPEELMEQLKGEFEGRERVDLNASISDNELSRSVSEPSIGGK